VKPREKAPRKNAPGRGALDEYRQKRDPVRTNEPFAPERKDSPSAALATTSRATRSGKFVVHLHDARRRHYDLRIQVGRTLQSFAVPKGPSLDPDEKRLAVHTEDHPLEYVDFEDVIPEGSYGAGAMIAWDIGRVDYIEGTAEDGIARGKIDFILSGYKLTGRFGLIQTQRGDGKDWLLVKKPDASARKPGEIVAEAPRSILSGLTVEELGARRRIAESVEACARELGAPVRELDVSGAEPMLCANEGARLDDAERLYELKLDGVRILADKRLGSVTLRYRNGGNCTANYPEVARAVEALPGERLVLDGEVVTFDERGRPRFERILPRIQARRPLDVARAGAEAPVVYLAFDLLAIESCDTTSLPLEQRKRLLGELVRGKGLVRSLDHIAGRGRELFAFCEAEGLEGVVAKKIDSPYRFGPQRSTDWVKVKCERDADFVVVGWIPGKGTRGDLGALCIASYDPSGVLRYRGRVGSGFNDGTLRSVFAELAAREQALSSLSPPLPEETRTARWVRPELVAAVRYLDFTDDGVLRAPVFRGLRRDVLPVTCSVGPPELALPSGPLLDSAGQSSEFDTARPGLKLSNRDKVFWPEEGYTKGDLLDYYASIADVMLPFLRGRPVVLVRHPDGIAGKSFFQWNVPRGTPDWIRRLSLRDADDPSHDKSVFLVDDVESLLYIVNLGCIPLHVLACREQSIEHCDFITIDLDLGGQPFARAVEIALTLREILVDAGLTGFPKTSGQGGVHLLVPLGAGVPFAAAKLLVELLGGLATARHAEFATMERRIDQRGGRLYVDTGQTGPSRTIVGPYSVRAHPGATVSTPLFWEELSGALDPKRFTLSNVRDRVTELGDAFASLLGVEPNIAEAIEKLERWVTRRT